MTDIKEVVSLEHSIFSYVNMGNEERALRELEDDSTLLFATEDQYGLTVLHLASQRKMQRLVKRLIKVSQQFDSFDIDRRDLNGNTALHLACASAMSELLFGQNSSTQATPDPCGNDDRAVVASDQLAIVDLLLERGACPDATNKLNYRPIHLASRAAQSAVVEKLVEYGVDVRAVHEKVLDVDHMSLQLQSLLPLTDYEERRKQERKDKILARLDDNRAIKNGPTCLHYALANLTNITSELRALQRTSADPTLINWDRDCQYLALIKLLASKGCNPNAIDESTGRAPLSELIVAWPSSAEDLESLVSNGLAPFFSLFLHKLLALLIRHGLNLSLCDARSLDGTVEGESALGHAAWSPARLLILREIVHIARHDAGVLEARNAKGQSPLFIACSMGNSPATTHLLEAGADPNTSDSFGTSALLEALSFNHNEVARLLLRCGADPATHMAVYPQSSALHLAAQSGDIDLIDELLRAGAPLDARDAEQRRAVDVAESSDIGEFIDGHVQVTLVHETSIIVPRYSFADSLNNHVSTKLGHGARWQLIADPSLVGKKPEEMTSVRVLVTMDSGSTGGCIRIKVRERGTLLFKYIRLTHSTHLSLISALYLRFGKSSSSLDLGSIETDRFAKTIKSLVLLPNISIDSDQDVHCLRDNDELEIEFHQS
eukprot:gene6179-7157_t